MAEKPTYEELERRVQELEKIESKYKSSKEALQKSENLFKLLYEKAPLGYQSLDENGHFIVVNKTWLDALGYAKEEVIGKSFADFLHPDWRDHFKENFPRFKSIGEILGVEFEMVKKNGDLILVSFTGKISRDEKGNFQQTHCIFHDITERKQVEAKMLYLQKSESLGRMAGAVAHHFNNQLSVVMGNIELVMDDLPDDAKIRGNLSQAFEASLKAANQSRQMLRYLGHISGNQTTINLSDVCRQGLLFLQSATPIGVTLNVDFPDSGPFVHADAGELQQVLTNLVTNAQDSLPENQGVIGLSIQTVSHEDISTSNRFPLEWVPQDIPYACLEISDTGCGISRKDIVKLFDPFYTTKFTGRGMGLSLTMGILKTHYGCIIVDSRPGCGSSFRVYLPVSAERQSVKHENVTRPKRSVENDGTMLLIEDEETVRQMAKSMLTRLGYEVIEAQDGVEAVKLFREHQNEIDCVLSDMTMPRMNGWETLTELRKINADIPVILASGYDKESVMAGDHPELPQAFLNKPYSMAALKDVLMEVTRL